MWKSGGQYCVTVRSLVSERRVGDSNNRRYLRAEIVWAALSYDGGVLSFRSQIPLLTTKNSTTAPRTAITHLGVFGLVRSPSVRWGAGRPRGVVWVSSSEPRN